MNIYCSIVFNKTDNCKDYVAFLVGEWNVDCEARVELCLQGKTEVFRERCVPWTTQKSNLCLLAEQPPELQRQLKHMKNIF
jgi:hypothetical protein